MNASRATPLFFALLLLATLLLVFLPTNRRGTSLHVAAASSLRASLPNRVAEFEQANPGLQVNVTYAASGTLAASIENGAPYDLFLCADESRHARLAELGLLTPSGVQPFATSAVVLVRRVNPTTSEAIDVPRIAIPNPEFAPFGKAAKTWLAAHPDFPSHTLVFADSVANAAGLFEAGAVDGAFVDPQHAARLAQSSTARMTPLRGAPPVVLTAGVVRSSAHADDAQRLLDFLRSSDPRASP